MMTIKTNLSFPVKLLPMLSDKDNSVISPYGIAMVLSMAAEGADESSLKETLSGLGLNSFDELREAVLSEKDTQCGAFKSENTITLVKGENDLELLEQFKKVMNDSYAAKVDEGTNPGESFVKLQSIADFKAEWLYKMERDIEQNTHFLNADGSICYPVFLNCTERMRYYKYEGIGAEVKAVALPYKVKGEKAPYELVLVDSENTLSEDILSGVFSKMRNGKCELAFPEFSISSEFDLIPMMKQLEIKNIFNKEAEPFIGIATEPLYAKAFAQKAKIEVDKNGTVARAITVMTLGCCKGCITPKNEKISFTEPFSYFLRNTDTGEIMFMGKVNKLSDCDEENTEKEEILRRL